MTVTTRSRALLRVFWLAPVFLTAYAQPTPAAARTSQAEQTTRQAWVTAANPLAVDAGLEILKRGGNAIDAAIAVQSVLGLVEPQSSGIAGGAFMMYYDAGTRRMTAFNGRETAPAAANERLFLDQNGKPLPRIEAIMSGRSTGVPGVMRMLELAHRKAGRLQWNESFAPAIRLAQDGFVISPRLAQFLNSPYPQPNSPDIRALFSRADGSPLQSGDRFSNKAYAKALQQIAANGADALYKGEIAAAIVARTHAAPLGGQMTLEDLSRYQAEEVQPLCQTYRTRQVCVPPPPSSGVGVLQLLALFEHTDIAKRGPNDPQAWYLFAQASRLMYADRDRYVADPRFVAVPVKQMLEPSYVARRAQLIGERAGPAPAAGEFPGFSRGADATREVAGTSHFVIVDAAGNVVSMTTTVESLFGSGRVVDGFVLNNQLTDFSFDPVENGRPAANAVAGNKRPRSSMSPIIVLDAQGNFVGAVGSPGGNSIPAYNGKALVATLGWNLDLPRAIALPNLIARGQYFVGEVNKFAPGVVDGLAVRGVKLQSGGGEQSGLHGIFVTSQGTWIGGADPRREGVARSVTGSP